MEIYGAIVRFDGASRGNPGRAAYAAALWIDGVETARVSKLLPGRATCNEAEYNGLLAGLQLAAEAGVRCFRVEGDSKLVIEQVFGRWACKAANLQPLMARAKARVAEFESVKGSWVPRARNARADALCNAALDGGAAGQSVFSMWGNV